MSGRTPTRREAVTPATASRRAEEPGEDEEDDDQMPAGEGGEDEEDEAAAAEGDQQAVEGDDGEEDDADGGAEASAERRRIAGILDAPEAAGRDQLARHFAFQTRLSVNAARAALKAAPQGGGQLSRAMQGRSPAPPRGRAASPNGDSAAAERILANAGRLKQRS